MTLSPTIIEEAAKTHAAALTLYARQFFAYRSFHDAEEVVQDVFFRLSRQSTLPETLLPGCTLPSVTERFLPHGVTNAVKNGKPFTNRRCSNRRRRVRSTPKKSHRRSKSSTVGNGKSLHCISGATCRSPTLRRCSASRKRLFFAATKRHSKRCGNYLTNHDRRTGPEITRL